MPWMAVSGGMRPGAHLSMLYFARARFVILAFSSFGIAKVLVVPRQGLPAEPATTDCLVASGQGLDG